MIKFDRLAFQKWAIGILYDPYIPDMLITCHDEFECNLTLMHIIYTLEILVGAVDFKAHTPDISSCMGLFS